MTLLPLDRRLIDAALLTDQELQWVDSYHSRVRSELEELIADETVRSWLIANTEPFTPSSD